MAVASIAVPPDPKRDADAAKLAQNGVTWPIYTLKRSHGAFPVGTVFYGVPSRSNPDQRWLANGVVCQCPDYQQRGAMCAHVRAVRLFEAQLQQQTVGSAGEADPTPVRASYADLFPVCRTGCGELVERTSQQCYRCNSEQARYLETIARRELVTA